MYNFGKSQVQIKIVFIWDKTCWCRSKIPRMVGGGSTNMSILAKLAPPTIPFLSFLSYANILCLKRSHFSCGIEIFEKYTWSYIGTFEKNWIFSIARFHIGVLCSKTLDGSDRVKKCTKKFKIWFSVTLLS